MRYRYANYETSTILFICIRSYSSRAVCMHTLNQIHCIMDTMNLPSIYSTSVFIIYIHDNSTRIKFTCRVKTSLKHGVS